MFIKRVVVSNFRSIRRVELTPGSITAIVGGNDVGKSNLLRALNLFFNAETDVGRSFSFREDFSNYANVAKQKAREVVVELELQPPENYKAASPLRWTKRWRSEGFHDETVEMADGSDLGPRSKIPVWARNLRYRYVPAVKGPEFFSRLLMDLHDVLSDTVEDELRDASLGFATKVKSHLGQIVNELSTRLSLDSDIGLPANLREIFASLEFRAKQDGIEVPLSRRGDGIKARHIPIILASIAAQENKLPIPGKVRINTIWGYEEPENNLETSKVFLLREELIQHSSSLQVLFTTHSPVLYNIKNCQVSDAVTYTANREDAQATSFDMVTDAGTALDQNPTFGILALVAPHVEEVALRAAELRTRLEAASRQIASISSPVLYVEGPTDVRVWKRAIELFAGDLSATISVRTPSESLSGAPGVADMLIAWAHSGRREKALAVFDSDHAGRTAKRELPRRVTESPNLRAELVRPPPHLHPILSTYGALPVCLEELFPADVWRHAHDNQWLEERPKLAQLYGHADPHKSFFVALEHSGLSGEQSRYVAMRVKRDKKKAFAEWVCKLEGEAALSAFAGFRQPIERVAEFFAG